MEHIMKLNENAFNKIKNGTKVREYRVNDEKRKQVRIGDTIVFKKLPDLLEEVKVEVKDIEYFTNWEDCYDKYFDIDFKDMYKDKKEILEDTYNNYYSQEESEKEGIVVFTIKKKRILHYNATACYLKKDDKVLMIKFDKKWGKVYAPPGGKFESGESPLECITREFLEETGLNLINPRLQGISFWHDTVDGIIFVYTAEDYSGNLKVTSEEGQLEWIKIEDLSTLNQFDQNKYFTPYLFKDNIFEAKFILDEKCKVKEYTIK